MEMDQPLTLNNGNDGLEQNEINDKKPTTGETTVIANDDDKDIHYEFGTTIMDTVVMFDVIQFGKSLIVWIGGDSLGFNDMSFAIETPYDHGGATSTKLFGNFGDTFSTSLASRLTARLHKPVYISFNMPGHDMRLTEEIERCLFHAISTNPERF